MSRCFMPLAKRTVRTRPAWVCLDRENAGGPVEVGLVRDQRRRAVIGGDADVLEDVRRPGGNPYRSRKGRNYDPSPARAAERREAVRKVYRRSRYWRGAGRGLQSGSKELDVFAFFLGDLARVGRHERVVEGDQDDPR